MGWSVYNSTLIHGILHQGEVSIPFFHETGGFFQGIHHGGEIVRLEILSRLLSYCPARENW
jgi:hypothetical protein